MRVLRRKYKEQLLQEALEYSYALNPAEMKKYLCFDDDKDRNTLKVPSTDDLIKEWKSYERYVTEDNTNKTQLIRVYGTPELYELDHRRVEKL